MPFLGDSGSPSSQALWWCLWSQALGLRSEIYSICLNTKAQLNSHPRICPILPIHSAEEVRAFFCCPQWVATIHLWANCQPHPEPRSTPTLPDSASCASGRVRWMPFCFLTVRPSKLPSLSRPLKGKGGQNSMMQTTGTTRSSREQEGTPSQQTLRPKVQAQEREQS